MFQYLIHIKDYVIIFDSKINDLKIIFLNFLDAFYADDVETRHNFQNYCFKLFNGLINWKISKQKTIIISSIKAEFFVIFNALKKLLWWIRFFEQIFFNIGQSTQIQCDNMQMIKAFIIDISQFIIKLRHVDIHKHWLRQKMKNKTIIIIWTSTFTILADGFTKSLPPQKHKEYIKRFELKAISVNQNNDASCKDVHH